MDTGTFLGLLTLVLLLLFVGIWLWAWSGSRKNAFEQAAQLPLDENDAPPASGARRNTRQQNRKQHDKQEA